MKLSQLKGNELLPKKKNCETGEPDWEVFGYNDAICEYESLEVDGDTQELSKIILNSSREYAGHATTYHIAQSVISQFEKWLVIKRDDNP